MSGGRAAEVRRPGVRARLELLVLLRGAPCSGALLLLLQGKLGLLLCVALLTERGEVGGCQRVESRLRGLVRLELLLLLLLE